MIDKVFSFLSITIVACFYPYTFYNYSILPNVIHVHFNIKGEIEQYSSKLFILLFPIILTAVLIVFKILPRYDKYSSNYKYFNNEMKLCELTIISFLSYALYLFQELGKGAFDIYAKLMFGIRSDIR